MFRFGAFALLGSCRGFAVSKPAAIGDLQDVARLAVQLADGYAAEAGAQQSPEGVLDDMRIADGKAAGALHKQMLAELSAGEGGPCVDGPCAGAISASASFLSAAPSGTIHLAEPDEALAREIASTAEALSGAFAALEQRQETTEAMLSSIAAPAFSSASFLASAAPVQASEPDTINIDFDVPAAGLRGAKSNVAKSAASSSASFLAASAASSPEVNVHVPVPSVSSREASAWLHSARAQVAALKGLLRRQNAAEESVKLAAATAGVSLLEIRSGAAAPGDDLAKAVLGVAESSAGAEVASALAPSNPLAGKVSDAAAAVQSSRAQADLFGCDADFAAACPDGWSQSGSACVAPATYAGPCEHSREFASEDVSAKALFADSCDAPWPCKGGSDGCPAGHNFGGCPKGWSQGRFGFCESSDEGPCGSAFHFADMAVSEKLDLAKACGFAWPCL